MEFSGESYGVYARTLQVPRQRLHLTPRIRQVLITDLRRHDPAPLDANLQSAEQLVDTAKGIKRAVQTIQPTRMILLVEAFRPQKQVKISKRALQVGSLLILARGY
jgi:hypothetical protein